MNAQELRIDAEKMRLSAQIKRKELDAVIQKIADYSAAGDLVRAQAEDKLRIKLEHEAMQFEQTAMKLEAKANDLEVKASKIEQQEEAIQADAKSKIDRLESTKHYLRGDTD
ncbi:MAG TPA: hypothetical protein VFS65_00515 [Candidatus Saccharimonadales bacterium]|nr:hypothetical protein [Candidatus Saccharimonadales bacterium]